MKGEIAYKPHHTMLILTVAMGISSCSGNCVHLLEKHKVRGTNTAWENIAFLPPAQRERLFINEEEWNLLLVTYFFTLPASRQKESSPLNHLCPNKWFYKEVSGEILQTKNEEEK